MTFLVDLFQPTTARLFPTASPFPALSVMTILFDKRQMKSIENINILIELKLLLKKNTFWEKAFI